MRNTYYGKVYLDYILVNGAAAVAAGRKPASLMTVWKYRVEELNFRDYVRRNEKTLLNGCCCEILFENNLYYLLFCYREKELGNALDKTRNFEVLKQYPLNENLKDCIEMLKDKIYSYNRLQKNFPHEVGLFLGYPIWDVEGFIRNKGQNYKICGYWKVYDDVPGALAKFEEYDRIKIQAVHVFKQINERNNHKN